jgi:putative ABC transport system permease protein
MSVGQHFLEAFESLSASKLRSGLTILGIVIGVAAVISMLAIGNGAQASVNQQIEKIGTNLLIVTPGAQNVRVSRPLTLTDANALSDPTQAPDILAVAPVLQGRASLAYQGQSDSTEAVGITPPYEQIRNLTVAEGDFINQNDVNGRMPVVVLGATAATNLFGTTTNIIGQTIQINEEPFQVVGVLQSTGGQGFGSIDDQVLVPLTTAQILLFHGSTPDAVNSIDVQAKSSSQVNAASTEITAILSALHNVPVSQPDFTIINEATILASAASITGTFTLFLGGIAAISLLVGGIGIMNIMLVSVTERTREIGLRKALGARKIDILLQFLIESAVLSLLGGIVGILLAYGISTLIGHIAASSGTALNPIIGWNAILLATLFSAAVGLFFGFYPANRAAGLEPVEALRYE